ncbi:MAG: hypothetical protein RMM53_01235 [Bacteroidia bacterium]|nr:hypothetical protein [Bacteroidia bacterium]MDW8332817.1 hypothetical protein [Bacteroidia bacterium]
MNVYLLELDDFPKFVWLGPAANKEEAAAIARQKGFLPLPEKGKFAQKDTDGCFFDTAKMTTLDDAALSISRMLFAGIKSRVVDAPGRFAQPFVYLSIARRMRRAAKIAGKKIVEEFVAKISSNETV